MTELDATPLSQLVARLGRGHADIELSESEAGSDPLELFEGWMRAALEADLILPNAVALATTDSEGRPSARMVLLKGLDARGFVFYTSYESRKGRELKVNPRAALVFHWAELERQVRVTGSAERVSRAESEEYWRSRPRASQVSAWASRQSEVVVDRASLDEAVRQVEQRYRYEEIPLPPTWGGYVLVPDEIEFWQGRLDRLHDRLRFMRGDAGWKLERLSP